MGERTVVRVVRAIHDGREIGAYATTNAQTAWLLEQLIGRGWWEAARTAGVSIEVTHAVADEMDDLNAMIEEIQRRLPREAHLRERALAKIEAIEDKVRVPIARVAALPAGTEPDEPDMRALFVAVRDLRHLTREVEDLPEATALLERIKQVLEAE